MSEHLIIPKRERSKYEHVWCNHCKRCITSKCGLTSKKVYTCDHGHQHRFQYRPYVPNSGNGYLPKTFETRDYREFKKRSLEYLHSLEASNFQPQREQPQKTRVQPVFLEDCILMYLDWLQDVNVPSHKKKSLSLDYVKEIAAYLKHFEKALKANNINHKILRVEEVGDFEVGCFHDYAEEQNENGEARFAPRTYNKAIGYANKFFQYLIDEEAYDIKNPFSGVKAKSLERDIEIIELSEFKKIIGAISPSNGIYDKLDRGKTYKSTHYQEWLKDAFSLMLETGERRDGVALMKWSHMKEKWIEIPNYKVNKSQKKQLLRRVPLTKSLAELLYDLGAKEKIGMDEYVIAPNMANRTTVKSKMSKAFTHFMNVAEVEKVVSMKHLRKTYATLMWMRFGDKAKGITGHSSEDTIIDHYLSKSRVIDLALNVSLSELSETQSRN